MMRTVAGHIVGVVAGVRGIVAVLAVVVTAQAAPAATTAPRPDLTIPVGSVRATGGKLVGSFAVTTTRVRAPASTAMLVLRHKGADHVLRRFAVAPLRAGRKRTVTVRLPLSLHALPAGSYAVRVCADGRAAVKERSERNNCRRLLLLRVPSTTGPAPGFTPTPAPQPSPAQQPTTTTPTPPPEPPCSTPACAPVAYTPKTVFTIADSGGKYWVYVPDEYDDTHSTPAKLLVWLHGCGAASSSDIYTVADYWQDGYIAIAPDGAENACWNMDTHPARVLTAIADVQRRFNIAPKRVVVGGYSSGGDLAYRTAFYNARTFAGVLAINTAPFQDTGSTQAQSLAAAAWKFNVLHVAHLSDDAYPIEGVRNEIDAMKAAGFPVTYVERAGGHYEPEPDGTYSAIQHDLVEPGMALNWTAPD